MKVIAPVLSVCSGIIFLILSASVSYAESPTPTVHWGGLAYPDQTSTLELGFTANRFTEFDNEGRRFDSNQETMGLNFGTVSWTEFWEQVPGWSTNLTFGGGPTGEQPTEWLQNEFVHDGITGVPKVPVGRIRNEFDLMIDGSLTYWIPQPDEPHVIFVGSGFSSGSLYHELFIRGGVRRVPLGHWLAQGAFGKASGGFKNFLSGFRVSGLLRYGRSYSGSAFREVSPNTYLGQFSLSWGLYDAQFVPSFELETGVMLHSGLFTNPRGDSLEEFFVSLVTLRIRHVTIETWNDVVNNKKDFGPTYGLRIMVNIYPYLKRAFAGSVLTDTAGQVFN